MFVVFYRSGQEPGAVKVWKKGGGGGEKVKEDECRVTVNPIFIESNTNDKQRRPCNTLQRPAYLIDQRREGKNQHVSHLLPERPWCFCVGVTYKSV